MAWRRFLLACAAVVTLMLVTAAPAGADPARPTNYRSTVLSMEPADAPVEVEILGGDAFVHVRAQPGREVLVDGYQREPYLRIRADGAVELNDRSPATYLNEERYGRVGVPDRADATAPPEWRTVARGAYAWHDHRVHWMSPTPRPGVRPGDVVQEWELALTVDGSPVTVRGELRLEEGIQPWPWVLLAGAVAVGVGAAGRRRPVLAASAAGLAAGLSALAVGWGEWRAAPVGVTAPVLVLALPAVAGAAGMIAAVTARRRPAVAVIAAITAAGFAGMWALARAGVFTHRILPTAFPALLDRAGTAVVAGAAVAAAGLAVWSGQLRTAPRTAGEQS